MPPKLLPPLSDNASDQARLAIELAGNSELLADKAMRRLSNTQATTEL